MKLPIYVIVMTSSSFSNQLTFDKAGEKVFQTDSYTEAIRYKNELELLHSPKYPCTYTILCATKIQGV